MEKEAEFTKVDLDKIEKILFNLETLNLRLEKLEQGIDYIKTIIKMPYYWLYSKFSTVNDLD